jgi:hypothetical protein
MHFTIYGNNLFNQENIGDGGDIYSKPRHFMRQNNRFVCPRNKTVLCKNISIIVPVFLLEKMAATNGPRSRRYIESKVVRKPLLADELYLTDHRSAILVFIVGLTVTRVMSKHTNIWI